MKKILIAFFCVLIAIAVILTGFTIHGRQARQTEIDNALTSSMKSAMELLLVEEGGPQNQEEWEYMFIQALAMQIESDSELTVHIGADSDMEKGILTAEAVLRFRHPIGTEGTVSIGIQTIILEEYIVE